MGNSEKRRTGGKRDRRIKGIRKEPAFESPGEEHLRREKEKARSLRQSAWWMRKAGQGVCHYCRRKVGSEHLTMDHVLPLSRGGKSQKGNLVPACKECNTKKKYLIPVEWEEYLRLLQAENDAGSAGSSEVP